MGCWIQSHWVLSVPVQVCHASLPRQLVQGCRVQAAKANGAYCCALASYEACHCVLVRQAQRRAACQPPVQLWGRWGHPSRPERRRAPPLQRGTAGACGRGRRAPSCPWCCEMRASCCTLAACWPCRQWKVRQAPRRAAGQPPVQMMGRGGHPSRPERRRASPLQRGSAGACGQCRRAHGCPWGCGKCA